MPQVQPVIIPSNAPSSVLSMCPTGGAAQTGPVTSTCPSSSANAEYIQRQVYAYPSMGGVNTVLPTDGQVLSLGGMNQRVSVIDGFNQNLGAMGGISGINFPMSGYTTGAAAGLGGCPQPIQIMSGALVTRSPVTATAGPITIQTQSGIQFQRLAIVPTPITGGAAPAQLPSQFADVPAGYWASQDINRLANAGIIAGYPDRTFKPGLPVSRAEFASVLVSGLNLQGTPAVSQQVFRDVPNNHRANQPIDKVYNNGLVSGYPDDSFRPSEPVSRAEALTIMSRSLPGTTTITGVEAEQILSQYRDGDQVPDMG
ncbi:MAG: S-layer homology domain-containing protein [Desulfobacterales bacterium]|nr:S-layer homology domain-containing protein [Desulfobacterales bacterium]